MKNLYGSISIGSFVKHGKLVWKFNFFWMENNVGRKCLKYLCTMQLSNPFDYEVRYLDSEIHQICSNGKSSMEMFFEWETMERKFWMFDVSFCASTIFRIFRPWIDSYFTFSRVYLENLEIFDFCFVQV